MEKKYNTGISLLKISMSFMVVCCHFQNNPSNLWQSFRGIAVPCFMLISFYLCAETLEEHNGVLIQKRINRLMVPYISWALVYWLVYKTGKMFIGKDNLTIIDLVWQILFGSSKKLNPTLWFMADQILLTIVIAFLFWIYDESKVLKMLSISGIVALIFQYTEINSMLFTNYPYETRYTLGRIAEMIPYAVIGIGIRKYKYLHDKIRKKKIFGLVCLMIFLLFCIIEFDYMTENGYGYQGVKRIIMTLVLFVFSATLPLEFIPKKIDRLINCVAKYTLGIYCIHHAIGTVMNKIFEYFRLPMYTVFECFTIFVTCLIISVFISLIPIKKIKYMVM